MFFISVCQYMLQNTRQGQLYLSQLAKTPRNEKTKLHNSGCKEVGDQDPETKLVKESQLTSTIDYRRPDTPSLMWP